MIVLLVILAYIQSSKGLTNSERDYYGGAPGGYDSMEDYGKEQEPVEDHVVCVNCSGIVDLKCNVPYRMAGNSTVVCPEKCEIAVVYNDTTRPPVHFEDCTIIRGCPHYEWSPAPPGYNIKFVATCSGELCNMYDKNIVIAQLSRQEEQLDRLHDFELTRAACGRHRTGIPLLSLLLTYHSIF